MTANVSDILERIHLDVAGAIRNFQHGGVELGVLRELAATYIGEEDVQLFLASMPNTPARLLEALIKSNFEAVLRQLALNASLLPKMITAENEHVRVIVAQNKKLPPQIALQLTADPCVAVRLALAHNPNIPPNVQLKLSQDEVQFVRMALLENRKLDEEFQIGLGDDRDTIVHVSTILTGRLCHACMKIWAEFDEELGQLALAGRNDLTEDVIVLLARSKYQSVRLQLLRCQQLPPEAQENFSAAADLDMALVLVRRRDLVPPAVRLLYDRHKDDARFRLEAARSTSLTDEVGLMLISSATANDLVLLQALALNAAASLPQTWLQLATQGKGVIHKTLLANPKCCQPDIVSALIEHGSEETLYHLVYRNVDCSNVSAVAAQRLAASPYPAVRALASQVDFFRQ